VFNWCNYIVAELHTDHSLLLIRTNCSEMLQMHSPRVWRWSLLECDRCTCARFSWWITSFYYPSCKNSHSALLHHTLLEMFDVTSLWVIVEQSAASTSSTPAENSPLHHARRPYFPLVSLQVKCLYIFSDCNRNRNMSTIFLNIRYEISCKSLRWESCYSIRRTWHG